MSASIPRARRFLGRIALVLMAAALAACFGGNVKPEEFSTFGLEIGPTATQGGLLPWQLALDEPAAADPIEGVRIATRERDGSYGVLKGARWSEHATELVQAALLRVFEDSGRLKGVARVSAGLNADFVLQTELRAFEADYRQGEAPVASIVLSARLVRSGKRDVLAARLFEQREPSADGSAQALAGAFSRAAQRMLPELRDWVFETGNANWAPPAAAH